MVGILALLFDPNTGLPLLLSILVTAGCIYWCRQRPSGLTRLACLFYGTAAWVLWMGGGLARGAADIELCTTHVETAPPPAFIKALPELMGVAWLTTRLVDTGIWLALLSYIPRGMISERLPMPERVTRHIRGWGISACIVGSLWLGGGPLQQLFFRYHPYWIATHEGNGATLPSMSLQRLDLHGANLSSAYLWGADLSGTNLRQAMLAGAMLRSANLTGADLRQADLQHANLIDAELASARLDGVNLTGALLGGAHLTNLQLVNFNLHGFDLRYAQLNDTNLTRADLSDINLRSAVLTDVNLTQADLTRADLSGSDLRGAILTDANLTMAKLSIAAYDRHTRWPDGFNPKRHGAIPMERARS
jgi:uncharacterized protein YjbI with pentapeptide repeats